MIRLRRLFIFATAAVALIHTAGSAKAEGDPDYITFGAGWYDFNKQDDSAGEFRLEYRSDEEFYFLKPFAAVAGTSSGSFFVGVGVCFARPDGVFTGVVRVGFTFSAALTRAISSSKNFQQS